MAPEKSNYFSTTLGNKGKKGTDKHVEGKIQEIFEETKLSTNVIV